MKNNFFIYPWKLETSRICGIHVDAKFSTVSIGFMQYQTESLDPKEKEKNKKEKRREEKRKWLQK